MRSLVVVGAGGLGREIAETILTTGNASGCRLRGFLDDDPASAQRPLPAPLLGPVRSDVLAPDDELIIGVGDPRVRWRVERSFEGAPWASVLHPTAVVSPRATIGRGCFLAPFSYVGPDVSIGDHAVVNIYASVGHDASIGRFAVLSPYATLNGHASIGDGVSMGTGAVLAVGCSVGEWGKVAAGAVVSRSAERGALVAGNPAKGRVLFRAPDDEPGPAGQSG